MVITLSLGVPRLRLLYGWARFPETIRAAQNGGAFPALWQLSYGGVRDFQRQCATQTPSPLLFAAAPLGHRNFIKQTEGAKNRGHHGQLPKETCARTIYAEYQSLNICCNTANHRMRKGDNIYFLIPNAQLYCGHPDSLLFRRNWRLPSILNI